MSLNQKTASLIIGLLLMQNTALSGSRSEFQNSYLEKYPETMTVNFVSSYFKKDRKFGFGKQGADLAKEQVNEDIRAYFGRDTQGVATVNYKYEEEFACEQIGIVNLEETTEKTITKTVDEKTQIIKTGSTVISSSAAAASAGGLFTSMDYASSANANVYAHQTSTKSTYSNTYNYTRVTTRSEYDRYQVKRDVLCTKKSNIIRVRAEVRVFSDKIKDFHADLLSDLIINHTKWTLDSYIATAAATTNQIRLILINPYLTQRSLEQNFGSKDIESLVLNMNNQLKFLSGFEKFKTFIQKTNSEEVILRIQNIDRAMLDLGHSLLNLEKGALYAMGATTSNSFDLVEVVSPRVLADLANLGYKVKFNLPNKIKNYSMCMDRSLEKAAVNEENQRETLLTAKKIFKQARESWDSKRYQDLIKTTINNGDIHQLPDAVSSEFQMAKKYTNSLPKTREIKYACSDAFVYGDYTYGKKIYTNTTLNGYSKFKDCVDRYLSSSQLCIVIPTINFSYDDTIWKHPLIVLGAHIICTSDN